MQIRIDGAKVDLSGNTILKNVDFEVNTESRIAIIGRNGCGKTTLLRLISGELSAANGEDKVIRSGQMTIGKLDQMMFSDDSVAMVDEIRSAYSEILGMKSRLDLLLERMQTESENQELIGEYSSLLDAFTLAGGFYFEKEYEAAIKKFGFTEEEKRRPIGEFSGGQRTKIAFLKLLLSKPDLLLLDEPTNHLDIDAVKWLEDYLSNYKKAFVVVSHDRMFLDNTVNEVYEIERGKTRKYHGNYTEFAKKKKEIFEIEKKQYLAQQKEIEHLNGLVERFRYKATKAAMAQSKIKQLERMDVLDAPETADDRTFNTTLNSNRRSAKDVLITENLTIGFDRPLSTVSIKIMRGNRVGIIGGNGLGKSTFLKTVAGKIPAISGEYKTGAMVDIGYFDQQMAQYTSNKTVLEDYQTAFPSANDFEARSVLGSFLFSGEDVFKTVDMLSGGERVRLALCKIFGKNPNFLILDEPTNHIDIPSKEALEDLLSDYDGTLLFVSHDRYFVKKIADSLMVFQNGGVTFFEHGYEQYESSLKTQENAVNKPVADEVPKPSKRNFVTPAKEKAKCEKALKKAEEKIALLEEKIGGLKEELSFPENSSDYLKLSELEEEIRDAETELDIVLNEWEQLAQKAQELL